VLDSEVENSRGLGLVVVRQRFFWLYRKKLRP